MKSIDIGDFRVDIITVVNGLVSETDRVRNEFSEHDAYGVALNIEGIQCLKNRRNISDTFDVSELDMVYAKHMERFGGVEIPSPAMYTFVDLVTELNTTCIALDMNDEDFTKLYTDTVGPWQFVKEHRVAKRGMKKFFDGDTPEKLAIQWDEYINRSLKSYAAVSRQREIHIANEIRDVANYRKDLLAIIDVERAKGVIELLEAGQ